MCTLLYKWKKNCRVCANNSRVFICIAVVFSVLLAQQESTMIDIRNIDRGQEVNWSLQISINFQTPLWWLLTGPEFVDWGRIHFHINGTCLWLRREFSLPGDRAFFWIEWSNKTTECCIGSLNKTREHCPQEHTIRGLSFFETNLENYRRNKPGESIRC